jgi:uncharacterized Ntn-hydrolase superfamily protein
MSRSFSGSLLFAALLASAPANEEVFSHTFSIVAYDPGPGDFGVAVSTLPPKVGNIVPWARAGVGAVATQAWTNGGFGPRGLELLAAGKSARETIDQLLQDDPQRDSRQIGVVDAKGNAAAYTGPKCMAWCGSKQGAHYTVQGNLLVSEATVAAMARAYEGSAGQPLGERLVLALEAGLAAGGDKRGHSSAAVLVVRRDAGGMKGYDRLVDVRVDQHERPVQELRRIFSRRSGLGARVLARPEGRDVLELGRSLRALGHLEGEPGRVFDDRLAAAVRAFKKASGLKEDEVVDAPTVEALRKALEAKDDTLYVGVAKADITPAVETFEDQNGNGRYDAGEPFKDLDGNGKWDPVFLAGFGMNRTAREVHDPIWARAVLFEKAGRRAMIVSCDLVGVLNWRVRRLREAAKGVDEVLFTSTHNHNGPDTIGLWGPFPLLSGVSDAYVRRLEEAVGECARKALAAKVPATLAAGSARVGPGVVKDIRPPDVRNETVAALAAYDRKGQAVAILVNFAMHPEGLGSKNRAVTSDYPHYVREAIERDFPGSLCIFVSADLGGMQTPDVKERTWEEIRRCGEAVAAKAREALAGAPALEVPEVKAARAEVAFPMENRRFIAGFKAGVFGKDAGGAVRVEGEKYTLLSEVSALRLGEALFVTVPGEALPEVGREAVRLAEARHPFLVGLGQDEIGYILPKEDFDPKKYEESMSLGPETAPTLLDALKKLLKGF